MAIVITEKWLSRKTVDGDNPTQTRILNVTGSAVEDTILTAVKADAAAPSSVTIQSRSLPRKTITLVPKNVLTGEEDRCIWEATVLYARTAGTPSTGDTHFSFDTTGGTRHIDQSLFTWPYPIATAPDTGKTIGLTKDGVEGVDIVIPAYAWTVRKNMDNNNVDDAYKEAVRNLTGRVNDDVFENNAAGEVLFLGARGDRQFGEDWIITYSFAAIENESSLTIEVANGTDITGIGKAGHQYLEVRYKEIEDSTGDYKIEVPQFVYVHAVYEEGDFDTLEL